MIKIGDKRGNFLIQAEIGRGGMGTIYFATDTMLNREVALKVIHPQLADNQQLMERFKIEAMTQARLNHPHIVTIFSFHRIEEDYFIAMEYVEGRSLKELLQEKKQLHPAEAVEIITQVAEGLRYAHSNNVIHRDIKPANILIDKDGKVKISDFGIAKIFGSQGLTKTGILVGTPWYTSPEQIQGKHIDFRSDLYSLGVTFYEVLTGRVPFDSETNSEFQIQKAHLETPPPRPSIYNPEIGIKLEKLILTALQKKVEKRFQNARDMIDELRKIRSDMTKAGVSSFPDVTQKIVSPVKNSRSLLLMPLKILAFLALLVAGVFLFIFLSGKSAMDEDNGGTNEKIPTPVSQMSGRAAVGGPSEQAESEAGAPGQNEAQQQKDEGEAASGTKEEKSITGDEPSLREEAAAQEKNQAAEPAEIKIAAEQNLPAQKNDQAENVPETMPLQEKAIPLQEPNAAVARLGNLDNELVRLRGLLEARDFLAADRLADALIESAPESRVLPMLGRVKFLLNNFRAAEVLWAKALQENLLISLDMIHLHGGPGENCLGQLKFKKKIVMFNSNTRGDHSFALTGGNIRAITLGDDLKISVSGAVSGQEIDEVFMVANKIRRREKERFLVSFINRYVL
jgi:serine/threonine-protein kinase